MTTRTVRRVARKQHAACGGYCPPIQPGDIYLEHTELPGPDAVFASDVGHPVRLRECAACATRYGRAAGLTDGAGR